MCHEEHACTKQNQQHGNNSATPRGIFWSRMHAIQKLNQLNEKKPEIMWRFWRMGEDFKSTTLQHQWFISLFVWGFTSHSTIWHSWGCHHYRWRASNFDLSRNSWPWSSEGSLACHAYCDTGHPFISHLQKSSEGELYPELLFVYNLKIHHKLHC